MPSNKMWGIVFLVLAVLIISVVAAPGLMGGQGAAQKNSPRLGRAQKADGNRHKPQGFQPCVLRKVSQDD